MPLSRSRTSKLRKKGQAVLDAKYDGKKGSRAAIFGGQSGDSDEGEEEEEEDLPSGDDDDDKDDDDEMGSFEDLEGGEEDDDSVEEQDDQDEDVASEDEDEDEEEEEEEEAPRPKKSKAAPSTNRAKDQDERVMVSQLKQAASADVEKGRAVKKQLVRCEPLRRDERVCAHVLTEFLYYPSPLSRFPFPSPLLPTTRSRSRSRFEWPKPQAFCDSLLESRIKLQKAVGASNLLPHPDQAPAYYQAVGQDDVDETLRELAGLSEELFELRQVRRLCSSVSIPPIFPKAPAQPPFDSVLAKSRPRLMPPILNLRLPHLAGLARSERKDRVASRLWRVAEAETDQRGGGRDRAPRRDARRLAYSRDDVRPLHSVPCHGLQSVAQRTGPPRDPPDPISRLHSFDPFLRATVTKWSDKVLAASGLAGGGSGKGDKKFKAVNQNAMAQIDHALSATGERERLVRRTKVRRGEGKPVGGVGAEAEKNIALTPLEEGEKETTDRGTKSGGNKEVDDECFDDSDFYQQLLRDVVESRMLDLGESPPSAVSHIDCDPRDSLKINHRSWADDATMTQLRHATALARGKKVKKVVDTRASKGRKIRYHVHEKVQNFMIPIEAGAFTPTLSPCPGICAGLTLYYLSRLLRNPENRQLARRAD